VDTAHLLLLLVDAMGRTETDRAAEDAGAEIAALAHDQTPRFDALGTEKFYMPMRARRDRVNSMAQCREF
jgi:hypothetical protein